MHQPKVCPQEEGEVTIITNTIQIEVDVWAAGRVVLLQVEHISNVEDAVAIQISNFLAAGASTWEWISARRNGGSEVGGRIPQLGKKKKEQTKRRVNSISP